VYFCTSVYFKTSKKKTLNGVENGLYSSTPSCKIERKLKNFSNYKDRTNFFLGA
jgi:hypothetical protein